MKNYNRKSIRLKGYDYSQTGAYFVTICSKNNEFLFGKIIDEEMRLNDVGRIVQNCWNDLPLRFDSIELDEFVIMPNHIHGIIAIAGAGLGPNVGAGLALPESGAKIVGAGLALPEEGAASRTPTKLGAASRAPTLGDIVGAFKSISAIKVNQMLSRSSQPLWQRNYYEHIIRDEESLNKIREYIMNNPLSWSTDRENPQRKGEDEFDKWLDTFRALRDEVQKTKAEVKI